MNEFLKALNAFKNQNISVGDINAVIGRHCGATPALELVLMLEELGRLDGDTPFFELLGWHWTKADGVGRYLDKLMAGPFYEAAVKDYYDYTAGMSPRQIHKRKVFKNQAGSSMMVRQEERAAYDSLPDEVTLYRGCYETNKAGLSWTQDKEAAQRFPLIEKYRGYGEPMLITAQVNKRDIVAVKLGQMGEDVITWKPRIVATESISAGMV